MWRKVKLEQEMANDEDRVDLDLDYPAISKQTLLHAVEQLTSHYDEDRKTCHFISEAVRLDQLPDYNEFFAKFLVPNQLCILSESATRDWRSRREWVCQDGTPDFDFLQKTFGEATVPVANCKTKEYSAHTKSELKMGEFLVYWQGHRKAGHPPTDENLYLKDWHFTRAFPDYGAYRTCSFFQSDWMNEFWDVREDIDDDYRFVYMGPKGTWTPFHADVFRSFSWSANICGRKKWIFFPPGEEQHLKDIYGSLVYDVTSEELKDASKFPDAHRAQHRIEIIQEPGETIFVPSGWHHQVHNLEDTISINHNWLNGCNVRLTWEHLKASLTEVQKEISDCCDMDGWDHQCQMILRALIGMDYGEFFWFMESVARHRIRALDSWKKKTADSQDFEMSQSCTHCKKSEDSLLSYSKCGEKDWTCETCADTDELPATCSQLQINAELNECSPNKQNVESESRTHPTKITHQTEYLKTHTAYRTTLETHTGHETAIHQTPTTCERVSQHIHAIVGTALHATLLNPAQRAYESAVQQTYTTHKRMSKEASALPCEQDRLFSSVLDLSESSHKTADGPGQHLHWGQCNVHHAVFDLASIALVLRAMAHTMTLSGLPLSILHHKGEDSKHSEAGNDRCVTEQGLGEGDILHKDKDQDGKEMNFDSLLKEISQNLAIFGVTGLSY